ncbi:hypothetical protein [Nitrosospira sp. Nl5]|uniref:hypothetical protein n=1 Tax=Nitrosospira sp. Nl5 TaxID=200120 RepID=UPI00115FD480|nr:hypothetical protein [Nitrosospira sp. Nl5]
MAIGQLSVPRSEKECAIARLQGIVHRAAELSKKVDVLTPILNSNYGVDGAAKSEPQRELPPLYAQIVRANLVERLVSKQRKLKADLVEKGATREQVKAIDDRITKLMAGLNTKVKELREDAR